MLKITELYHLKLTGLIFDLFSWAQLTYSKTSLIRISQEWKEMLELTDCRITQV